MLVWDGLFYNRKIYSFAVCLLRRWPDEFVVLGIALDDLEAKTSTTASTTEAPSTDSTSVNDGDGYDRIEWPLELLV